MRRPKRVTATYLAHLAALANIFEGRVVDESDQRCARVKTMREEAGILQRKLTRGLRRIVVFHAEYARELGSRPPRSTSTRSPTSSAA